MGMGCITNKQNISLTSKTYCQQMKCTTNMFVYEVDKLVTHDQQDKDLVAK